ncbi:MAG TPA: ThiF family adenylyltransferase [Nitrososphaeraceae archaeon]|nr:ThiF family adenylyltransferase [Nitrososphaeraceae archaeon]
MIFPEVKRTLLDEEFKNNEKFLFSVNGSIIDESTYQIQSIDHTVKSKKRYQLLNLGNIILTKSSLTFNISNLPQFEISLKDFKEESSLKNFVTDSSNNKYEILVIIQDYSNLYRRIATPEYPLGIIIKKNVAIIGLGSGGSLIALYLAKSGIGNLTLIDGDVIMDHNIVRHICSLKDVGRYKTLAVKDYILDRVPTIKITTVEKPFSRENKNIEAFFDFLLSKVDLIVSATGDNIMNETINEFGYKRNIPIIFAGAFEKITGGIMIRIDPRKKSICYKCIYKKYGDDTIFQKPQIIDKNYIKNYGRDVKDMLTQPGLGIDIDLITLPTVKFILSTLLAEKDIDESFKSDIYYWFNKNLPDRKVETLVLYQEDRILEKIPDCHICSEIISKVD